MPYCVIGLAKSGVAAANALACRGEDVLASDLRDEHTLGKFLDNLNTGVDVELGTNRIRKGDTVVVSPGVKPNAPVFTQAAQMGCEVIGEVALFQRLSRGVPILAVTGTDGKSTTTTWLGEMCRASGRPTWVGGNLGTPLCESLNELTPDHVVVAEISCFQLSTSAEFHPRVAVVTNLAPDHLDYYGGSYENYVAAKRLITQNLSEGDSLVVNMGDEILSTWRAPSGARTIGFGLNGSHRGVDDLLELSGEQLRAHLSGVQTELVSVSALNPPGRHNIENALAAAGAALAYGIEVDAIRNALSNYGGLEHRIEYVATVGGVRFYNDSKATNPHASEAALRAFDEPPVLICGGSDKGADFSEWAELAVQRCRHVICCGDTADRMSSALGERVAKTRIHQLQDAVAQALHIAEGRGIVVLSPACASFDQFNNFEHRGRQFKEWVHELTD